MKTKFILLLLPLFNILLASEIEIPTKGHVKCAVEKELSQVNMTVEGSIPLWMKGVLVRNGPVEVTIGNQQLQHWFDGPAMLHSFTFYEGKVSYTNRFLRSLAYQKIFQEASFDYPLQFGSGPVPSFFGRVWNFLSPSGLNIINNANVNVWQYDQQYIALTEVPPPVRFDLRKLETLGMFEYQDDLGQGRQNWESAHPHFDFARKENVNYLIEYDYKSYYIPYRMKENSSNREILCKIHVEQPSYMHSFAITEHYLILAEFPLLVKPIDFILQAKPFIENFRWKPEQGTRFIVIDREKGLVTATFQVPPFFAFHHVNAYEESNDIILDLVTYPDASIIRALAQEQIRQPERYQQTVTRYRLSLDSQNITSTNLFNVFLEFPRINQRYDGRCYQFMYGVDPRGQTALNERRPLYKVDMKDGTFVTWSEPDCCCGEPVFVPSPDAKSEDEGIILSILRNFSKKRAFLLILDAQNLEEIGRAEIPLLIPADLHGQYFDSNRQFPLTRP